MIKVLIVEDELYTRKGLIETTPWKECSCMVVGEAHDGIEGLEKIQELRPDLVITDVRMLRMSGIEMVQKYNDMLKPTMDNLDVVFIILSGYEDFHYAQRAISLGVKEYLLKPVDDDALVKVLKKVSAKILTVRSVGCHDNKTIQDQLHEYDPVYTTSKSLYVKKAVDYIIRNYIDDITIGEVAKLLSITESYLSRIFKRETTYTFLEYLSRYRIKKACELMREEDMKIYQIAELVGFEDSRYFSAVFKKYLGKTPTEVRANILS